MLQKRPTQHAFLYRADLPEGAVSSTVPECRTRFEPARADDIERVIDDQPRRPR